MKPAALRALVERMTDAPWFARGRQLTLVPNTSGVGGTLHTNHIANFADPANVTGVAALRNHADAVLALVEAAGRLAALQQRDFTGAELDAALDDVVSAHAVIEASP